MSLNMSDKRECRCSNRTIFWRASSFAAVIALIVLTLVFKSSAMTIESLHECSHGKGRTIERIVDVDDDFTAEKIEYLHAESRTVIATLYFNPDGRFAHATTYDGRRFETAAGLIAATGHPCALLEKYLGENREGGRRHEPSSVNI